MSDSFRIETAVFMNGYWIIDSLDSFKNMDHGIKTPLCVAGRHNTSAVALIETSSVNLSEQSILYYKLQTFYQLNSQWRTSTTTTCLHDVSVSVPSKQTGSEGQFVRWGVFDLKQHRTDWSVYNMKVPRERFESLRSHLLSVALVVLWCHTMVRSARRCFKSNQERDFGQTHFSLSPPRPRRLDPNIFFLREGGRSSLKKNYLDL